MKEGQHEDTIDNLERLQEENNDLRARILVMKRGIENAKALHMEFMGLLVELLHSDMTDEMKVTAMMIATSKHQEASLLVEEEE